MGIAIGEKASAAAVRAHQGAVLAVAGCITSSSRESVANVERSNRMPIVMSRAAAETCQLWSVPAPNNATTATTAAARGLEKGRYHLKGPSAKKKIVKMYSMRIRPGHPFTHRVRHASPARPETGNLASKGTVTRSYGASPLLSFR